MRLFEYEGKDLFEGAGINVPKRFLVSSVGEIEDLEINYPVVVKAQVLSGKRGKRGLVKLFDDKDGAKSFVKSLLGKEFDGEKVEKVLVEEASEIERELYVSVTYSTKTRGVVLLLGEGGVDVEQMREVVEIPLDIAGKEIPSRLAQHIRHAGRDDKAGIGSLPASSIEDVVKKLWSLFWERDLFLAEINPLALTKEGKLVALDAKVVSDDAGNFRQKWELPERNMLGKAKSWAELEAEKIDAEDHRGAVGRVYLDLEGDIGVIAAGGGASLVAMDAMVSYGLKPANYTEFSGNPPEWKVERLSEIVMSKKGLKGVILVGGKANFTDQVETLSGFAKVLRKMKPKYPIVVRRDGPRMDEAKKMLEDLGKDLKLNLVVYDANTPIVEAIGKMNKMVEGR